MSNIQYKKMQWADYSNRVYPMTGAPDYLQYDYVGFIIRDGEPVNIATIKHDISAVYDKNGNSINMRSPHYYRAVFLNEKLFLAHFTQEEVEQGDAIKWAQYRLEDFASNLLEL